MPQSSMSTLAFPDSIGKQSRGGLPCLWSPGVPVALWAGLFIQHHAKAASLGPLSSTGSSLVLF